MYEQLLKVCDALTKLEGGPENKIMNPGSVESVATAYAQLVNDPSCEATLKDLLVAAIAFHLRHKEDE